MSRVNLFSVLIVDLIFSTPPFRISPAIGLLETRISISKMVNQTNEFRNIPLLPLPLLSASPSARAKSNQFINCLYSTCLLSSALLLASSSHLEFCCVLLLFIFNLPLSSLVVALFLNAIFFLASFGAIYLLCFPYVSMNISSSLRPSFWVQSEGLHARVQNGRFSVSPQKGSKKTDALTR